MGDYLTLHLYRYEETERGFELYLSELSTLQGLSYFALETHIQITDFGAEIFKQYGWISIKDLPSISNINDLITYFRSEPDLILIDFEITLDNIGTLSTHDDGECHFIFESKLKCMTTLEKATSETATENLKSEILNNPGLYIDCKADGSITKYDNFKDYLKNNP